MLRITHSQLIGVDHAHFVNETEYITAVFIYRSTLFLALVSFGFSNLCECTHYVYLCVCVITSRPRAPIFSSKFPLITRLMLGTFRFNYCAITIPVPRSRMWKWSKYWRWQKKKELYTNSRRNSWQIYRWLVQLSYWCHTVAQVKLHLQRNFALQTFIPCVI